MASWKKVRKALINGMVRVARLRGLGPRDPPKRELETIGDMDHSQNRRDFGIRNVSSVVPQLTILSSIYIIHRYFFLL